MSDAEIVDGLNLWMDAFIADPDAFRQQFAAARDHLIERNDGVEPTYGQTGLAFMRSLLAGPVSDG